MEYQELNNLENSVQSLLDYCNRLKQENAGLKRSHQALLAEKEDIIKKNDIARKRIEAMLNKLQAMEMDA